MNVITEIFVNILKASLLSSIIIAIVLLIKAIAKDRIYIRIISFMWVLVVLRLCLPGMVESPVNINQLFQKAEETTNQAVSSDETTNTISYNNSNMDYSYEPTNNMPYYGNEGIASDLNINESKQTTFLDKMINFMQNLDLWLAATIIWIAGGITIIFSAIKEIVMLRLLMKKHSKPIKEKVILNLLDSIRSSMGIKRKICISTSKYIKVPLTFGVFNPQILLPKYMVDNKRYEYIDSILLHEACHIKRIDIVKNYIFILVKALHWFNPIVWLSVKKMREDIEFACDNTVLKNSNKKQKAKYCEALYHVTSLTNQRKSPQLVTSLCENKSNLKERIIKIIKPEKKTISAGVIAVLITIIMIIGCFTTACQPTPENLVVQNKDKEELMEAVHAEKETSTIEHSEADDTEMQDISVEHWTQTVNSGEGTVEINIDADIITPAYEQLPVVILTQKTFSESELAKIVTALVGDREVYEYAYVMTKSDIDEQIIKTKMQMTDLNSDMASSSGAKTLEELTEIGNQELERLEALISTAPESIERNAVDKNNLSQLGNEYICLQADFDKGTLADLVIENHIDNSISVIFSNTGKMDEYIDNNSMFVSEADESSNFDISKQEVESVAYELLNKLPAESMDISSIEYGFLYKGYGAKRACYKVSVSRCVDGMYVPYIKSNDSSMESETSARPVKPEYMNIYIDDSGIIGLFWSSPMETQEVINENAQILDFDEIKQYFVQQFLNKYSYETNTSAEYVRYNITEITLSLARIKMPDNPDKYMLVPVWDFFGERCIKYNAELYEQEKETIKLKEENGVIQVGKIISLGDNDEIIERFEGTSYMTINALNGASINRNLGY